MIEWEAVREAASRLLSMHAAESGWKHRTLSHVEQDGLPPMPKDRGAEPGDVDGPLECSLALGIVAAETRLRVAAPRAARTLPGIGIDDPVEKRRLQAEHEDKMQKIQSFFQLGGPEKNIGAYDPRHALQESGGLADQWYVDGGDNLYHPKLVRSYLHEFDAANDRMA